MTPVLVAHIIAGSLGILTGFVALYSTKGMALHRRAGMVFVIVMLTMTITGAAIAATRGAAPAINIPAAMLTSYLVITGLTTVRPPSKLARTLLAYLMFAGFEVGAFSLTLGLNPSLLAPYRAGIPAFPFFLFGVVGLLGSIGDFRLLRTGGQITGAPRITRHLWRMTFALWIAVMSFFLGQADEIPQPYRIMPLLATPVIMVLVTMVYWVWRVRIRKSLRGFLGGDSRVAARAPARAPVR